MIEFINVSKKNNEKNNFILNNINIKVDNGEFVYITGPSGAGKTTLLKMIYRDKKPSSGQVLVFGKNIGRMNDRDIPGLRRELGVVFQDFKLLRKRSVYKNISFALEVIGKDDAFIAEKVDGALNFIGLQDKKDLPAYKLSAGEKQRVAIARAIINNPSVLICDEITGNLNHEISTGIMKLLMELNKLGTTVLFATHDRQILEAYPKRVIRLEKGVIVDDNNN